VATLEQLRAAFGGDSDEDTINRAAQRLGMSPFDIADEVGVRTGRNRGALAAGLSSGVDDMQALGFSALAAGADALGMRGPRDYLNRRAQDNQVQSMLNGRPDLERVEDVYDKPGQYLPYLGYQIAKQVPQVGASVAATALVPGAAIPAALAGRSALLARTAIGAGAVNYAQGVGSLYQSSVEGGDPNAGAKALAGGVPYAVSETIPEALLFGRVMRGTGFSGALPTRMAKAAGTQAAAGTSTELLQNEMEMAYHGGVSPEDAFSQRLNAGVAGGLVEGAFGLAGGRRRTAQKLNSGAPVDLTKPEESVPALGFRGYDTGVGDIVAFPDGSAMLRSEYEALQRQNRQRDGSLDFLPPAMSEVTQPPSAPYQYEGAIPFEEVGIPPAQPRASALQIPAFEPRVDKRAHQPFVDVAGRLGATDTGRPIDLLAPASPQPIVLTPEDQELVYEQAARKADAGLPLNQTEQLVLSTRNTGGPAPALALPAQLPGFQLSGTPTPQFTPPMPDARPALDLQMQEANPAQGELDLQVPAAAPIAPTLPAAGQRGTTPQLPFSSNTKSPKGQVLQGLADSLHEEGHLDDGTHTQVSTLIARGRFGDVKKHMDQAIRDKQAADALVEKATKLKEKADASGPGAAEQGPGRSAASGAVQRDGSQRDAAPVQPTERAPAPTNGAEARGGEAAPAVPADDEHPSALGGVTSEALVETADDAKDAATYESSLDELYRRWRDDGDEVAEKFFEDNAKVPGFAADLARVRERAGEQGTVPQQPNLRKLENTIEGKRGLRLGRQGSGELTEEAKGLDSLMRGLVAHTDEKQEKIGRREFVIGVAAALAGPQAQAQTTLGKAKPVAAATINQRVSPQIEKLLRAGQLKAALNMIAATGPKELRTLAQRIAKLLPDSGYKASVVDGDYNAHGAVSLGETPELRLFQGKISQGLRYSTVLHEALHLAVAARYRALSTGLLRSNDAKMGIPAPKAAKAMAQFRAVWEEFQQVARVALKGMDTDSGLGLSIEEAMGDPDEFFVRALTDPDLQGWMAQQEYKGKTLWERFKTWIKEGLFLWSKPEGIRASWLDAALVAADDLLAASEADTPDFTRLRAINTLSQRREAVKREAIRNTPADTAVAKSFAEFPGSKSTLGQKIQDALFNLRESPWALKWVTNDQIAEGYAHLKPVGEIHRATSRMAAVANRYLEGASQTAKRWRALPDDVQLAMQRVMLKSTMDEMHVSIEGVKSADEAWKHESNNHLDREDAKVKRDFYALYREFHALPAPARAVYDTVRKDLAKQHEDTLRALRKSVADQYAGQLSRALTDAELQQLAASDAGVKAVFAEGLSHTGSAAEIRALEHLYRALRDLNKDFGTVRGPYFPLVRFGDHVVVMKAADLVDQEMDAQAARLELQKALDAAPAAESEEAEAHNAKVDALREEFRKLQAKVDELKADEKKYIVEFHETPAQAERARAALAAKYPGGDVYRSVREQYYRALDGASPAFLNDLTHTLAAALDSGDGVSAEAKDTAIQAMKDMYLRRQPERSALRSELKRLSIEGVQAAQMLRGYAQASRNNAWRISRLLHAGEVTQGLAALSEDRRSPDAKHVLNELKARFVGDLAPPNDNRWLQRLGNATYFMHLGFNLSYFAINATQAWAISLPVMGGRHGIVNSANSLMAASKDVVRLLANATAKSVEENGAVVGLQLRLSDEQINSLAKDPGEAKMLKALTDDGVIDITIKHDLGAISDGTTKSIPGRVMELSAALANYPELYNRLSTALAAYRMESARRDGGLETAEQVQERAQAYAENIINRTHFNYSPENAPRMMRGQLGRLVFQFKRYQQGMIYLFARLVKQASNGDADARRSLAWLLGATSAIGGVSALPIAAPMALALKVVAAAYPDDEEPEWLQQWYNGMKDAVGEDAAQVLAKGMPTLAGVDVSKRMGQGDLLNPAAFARTEGKPVFSADYWMAVGFGLLGPGAALLANEADAVGYAKNGDFQRAAEKGMPTFVANVLKAMGRADEGLTTKSGDTILSPEEFGVWAGVAKGVGFEGVNVSDAYDQRSAYLNMIQKRSDARRALLRDYYEAVKAGDRDKMVSAQEAIAEFNSRQQADRVRPGDLRAALRTHAQRALETRDGLRVGKRDTDTFRRLQGE
jgi:hypothetical protein